MDTETGVDLASTLYNRKEEWESAFLAHQTYLFLFPRFLQINDWEWNETYLVIFPCNTESDDSLGDHENYARTIMIRLDREKGEG